MVFVETDNLMPDNFASALHKDCMTAHAQTNKVVDGGLTVGKDDIFEGAVTLRWASPKTMMSKTIKHPRVTLRYLDRPFGYQI